MIVINVVWTERAKADIRSWLDYMASRNPFAGQEVVVLVLKEAERICEMPLIGKAGAVYGTREKKVSGTPLRLVYHVRDDVVHILFVPHDRQQWPPSGSIPLTTNIFLKRNFIFPPVSVPNTKFCL